MDIYSFQVHNEHSKNLFPEQVKTIGFGCRGLPQILYRMDVSFYLSVLEGDERETYTGGSRPSKGAQVSLIYPTLFMLSVTPFQMESSRNKQPQIINNTVHVSGGL